MTIYMDPRFYCGCPYCQGSCSRFWRYSTDTTVNWSLPVPYEPKHRKEGPAQ